MGVDLELMPVQARGDGWCYAHDILSCDRDQVLWVAIRQIESQPVAASFESPRGVIEAAGEQHYAYGPTRTDAYAAPLRCVTAGALAALASHPGVTGCERNRAVWAYLAALKPDRLVAIYWC